MQNKWIKNHFIVAGGVIICLLLSCSTVTKRKYNYSSELETLYRPDLLPDFRSNCIVEQISSYDIEQEAMMMDLMALIHIFGKKVINLLLQK